MYRTILAAAILTSVAAASAHAQAPVPSRQQASLAFDQQRPASASGLRIEIDYVNPSDPAAKPFAVQTVVEALAAGSRIDTGVPQRCAASDAELTLRGAAACPPDSRVGAGEVDLDTGLPGPARIVRNRVTQFNNTGELILLFEQENGSRAVSRARIEGASILAQAPPLPGGPPDGFTAIKRVRLTLERISAAGRAYVTTPGSCPSSRAWTNQLTFTYRDGQSQTVDSRSTCGGPGTGTAPQRRPPRPRILVAGVPRSCACRPFTARVGIRSDSPVRASTVRLDGRLLRHSSRSRFDLRVPVRGLRRGWHRLLVSTRDRAGSRASRVVRFRRC